MRLRTTADKRLRPNSPIGELLLSANRCAKLPIDETIRRM